MSSEQLNLYLSLAEQLDGLSKEVKTLKEAVQTLLQEIQEVLQEALGSESEDEEVGDEYELEVSKFPRQSLH